jgi:hypothetical protein
MQSFDLLLHVHNWLMQELIDAGDLVFTRTGSIFTIRLEVASCPDSNIC